MSAPTSAQIRETPKLCVTPVVPPTAVQVRQQRSIAPCARTIRNPCDRYTDESALKTPACAPVSDPVKCEPEVDKNVATASFESIYTRNCHGRFDELDEYKIL